MVSLFYEMPVCSCNFKALAINIAQKKTGRIWQTHRLQLKLTIIMMVNYTCYFIIVKTKCASFTESAL